MHHALKTLLLLAALFLSFATKFEASMLAVSPKAHVETKILIPLLCVRPTERKIESSRPVWSCYGYDLASGVSVNWYAYVGGDPVNRVDPSGYYSWSWDLWFQGGARLADRIGDEAQFFNRSLQLLPSNLGIISHDFGQGPSDSYFENLKLNMAIAMVEAQYGLVKGAHDFLANTSRAFGSMSGDCGNANDVADVQQAALLMAAPSALNLALKGVASRLALPKVLASPKREWKFGTFKSTTKWQNQLDKRGWTTQQIDEAIIGGQDFGATNMVNPVKQPFFCKFS
jgi:hypothetical protein